MKVKHEEITNSLPPGNKKKIFQNKTVQEYQRGKLIDNRRFGLHIFEGIPLPI